MKLLEKLGVDFGTTRTVVACVDRGNYPIVSFLDEAGDAHDWFPSLVAERAGELRFGWAAFAVHADPSFATVRSFKRLLSDAHAVPGTRVRVGSLEIPIDELVTRFLTALLEAVRHRSNVSVKSRTPATVASVVAVPANANAAQRFVTLDAFRRAGFAPRAMLNEPSAAGFEYSHRHRDTLTSKRDHVVVYDLGGGTFDASLVRMRGRAHEVLATAGVNRLGGDDFDEVLLELACDAAKVAPASLSASARAALLDQCRDAKERLNPSSRRIALDLPELGGEAHVAVADFYAGCEPLIGRTIDAMAPLMARLEGAAATRGDDDVPGDVAGIYVVGGASELPIVARALRERFGRRVHRSPYPSAAIAIGLAIACDEEGGFELADRYARTFGVFREAEAGSEITFDPIFTSDTPIPSKGARVTCKRDYRAAHNVGHFRFFECTAVGDDGRPRGDMTMSGDVLFPFDARLGGESLERLRVERLRVDAEAGPRIEEEYALDENGMVAITIRNLDVGYERVFRFGG
jgi:molecular chaperone DnaK (HSP70)